MSASGFDISNLQDSRLALLATSQLPAWLWSVDATRIVWANPVGAAIFGASTSAAINFLKFDAAHPAAAQIARLATTLARDAPPRLERLCGLGTELGRALTCACTHIMLRDGTPALLVVAAERAGPELTLGERAFAVHENPGTSVEPLPPQGAPRQDAAAVNQPALRTTSGTAVEAGCASSPPELSRSPERRAPIERRHPLRFVWQLDEHGCFTLDSDEFIELTGVRTAAMIGKPWADMAAELALDPEGGIARAIATHDTWSGLTVSWPVDDGKDRLPVELSGLPVFDRERIFRGYRGFGVCRDNAQLTALAIARQASMTLSEQLPGLTAASAPEERLVAAMDVPGENIVPFPAGAAEVIAPALTAVEHMAFRELSRKLTQGLAAAGVAPDVGNASRTLRDADVAVAETDLAETASDARPMLDRIPVGILIYRLDALLYANPIFLQWSGYRTLGALIEAGGLDELFIEPISATAAGNDQSLTLRMDRGDKVTLKGELINIDWEGEPAHALVTALKERAPNNKPEPLHGEMKAEIAELREKLCIAFRDIAQWKQTEQELIEAKRRAEAASAAKSDFLAKISHEIRTPLNSIIGFSEVMMQEQFGPVGNERYREYLKDIHASGGHLLSLINDLLDLSKIEAGKLQLAFTGVALNDLTQQCVAVMQPQANRGRIIIRTALAPALPQVVADARSLRQIVLNLLSNSLKFTAAGGQVIVSTALTDDGEVVLRVRDTGVGMTEKDIVTALEPFRQLATSPRGGTGLGLPLTKAMAEANRAKFHLSSTPKEGTLVEITFPASSIAAG